MQLYHTLDQGTIKLGDQKKIADFSIESWRDKIGYVPQDSFLFSDSVKNNISFGLQDEARYDHIEICGSRLCPWRYHDLPEDYHTMVGERGG